MSFPKHHKLLDDLGWRILEVLQADARVSFSELGRRVGLSTPAVTERVRRMEDAGIIKRKRSARDKRAVELSLSAAGQKRADETRRLGETFFHVILDTRR